MKLEAFALMAMVPIALLIGVHTRADTGPGYYKPIPPRCNYEWTLPDGSKLCLDGSKERFDRLFPECPVIPARGDYEE